MVHLTPALFGDDGAYGGAERWSYELARKMAGATPTTLVSFGNAPREFSTHDGLRVRVLGPAWKVRGQPFNRIHPRLLSALRHADVVHCHQPRLLASEVAALASRLAGRRVFATDLGSGGWGASSYIDTDRWFHGHLHISEYSRRLAARRSDGRAAVVYAGVDTSKFSPDPSVKREPLVVFVGRLLAHKGINDLINALPEGLRLELIGRPYDETFHADLRALAEGKPVSFRTDCSDDDIVQAYRRALCVALPSVYRDMYGNVTEVPELLGQTPLEGMACGAPAIVTDVASLPEVVTNGETGFIIPPNDPAALRQRLEWLRDHPAEASSMGEAGRQRVLNHFSWPQVVERCLAAYRSL